MYENCRYALTAIQPSEKQVLEAAAQVGLADYLDTPVAALSRGQRQRAAWMRVLSCSAQIWLLDEPFTGLDQAGRLLMAVQLEQHLSQQGVAVIATHHALPKTLINSREIFLGDACSI